MYSVKLLIRMTKTLLTDVATAWRPLRNEEKLLADRLQRSHIGFAIVGNQSPTIRQVS